MGKHLRREIERETVLLFEKTEAQLEGFYEEIGNLAKKKPDDPLNKFKLDFINQALAAANSLLDAPYRPFPNFETFDIEGTLPSSSDVVTILSQYLRSMDIFRQHHTTRFGVPFYWNLRGQTTDFASFSTLAADQQMRAKRPKDFD